MLLPKAHLTPLGLNGYPLPIFCMEGPAVNTSLGPTSTAINIPAGIAASDQARVVRITSQRNGSWVIFRPAGDTTAATATNGIYIPEDTITWFLMEPGETMVGIRQGGTNTTLSIALAKLV